MKKISLLLVGFIFFCCSSICMAGKTECFVQVPGQEDIAYDTPDAVKITKLKISSKKVFAYIATEYLGAANLQATLYLKKAGEYCFSGDLGAATDFGVDKSIVLRGFYGIAVTSNSGEYKFRRRFSFDERSESYRFFSCRVKKEEGVWKKCTAAEE